MDDLKELTSAIGLGNAKETENKDDIIALIIQYLIKNNIALDIL